MMKQGENVTEEQEQILTFHEEGEIARTTVEEPQNEFRRLKDLDDVLANDVVGFLKRPIHYQDFEWLATNPDAVELVKEISLPGDWLNNTMIYEKLSGFKYFKCNFKIRVQVNAQPFNAGYLLMTYIPLHRQNTLTPTNVTSFSGLTGYRRVMLDLSEDTSAELTVPYNNVISHFDLIEAMGYLGVVKLYVYSPLTGSDNVDGTVWVTAEDVEVVLPTGLPAQKFTPSPDFYHRGPAHSGQVPTKKDSKMQTNPPKRKGPVSTIANGVGQVAGVLKDVPVIGSIASTVEWGSEIVSGIASFFGFSKPTDTSLPCKETLVVAPNFANYDGDSKAKSLAFFSQNETEIPVEVFGTEQDEMSFSHILAQPVYLTRFKMRQTDKQGTVIWRWPVDPMSCQKILPNDPTKAPYIESAYICQNTYLSYLSNFFKYWRGTIKYHIRIVKTAFHSGRIRVYVVPGATVDTAIDSIDFNKVHSVVYDIRDTTVFDVEVPYKWNAPWKPVDGVFRSELTPPSNLTPNRPTAMVYIQVVNALRNPSTAADMIDFVVETSAGDDFQFAVPMVNYGIEIAPTEESLKADYPAMPTSGPAHSGSQILDNAGGDQIVANKIAVGEVITGWRTLLKRYSRFLQAQQEGQKFITTPYDSIANQNKTKTDFDHFSACELLYRFRGGSLRIASELPDNAPLVVTHEVLPHDSLRAQPDTLGAIVQSRVLEPVQEIAVPFYQETIAVPTALGKPTFARTVDQVNYQAVPNNEGTKVRSTNTATWWRAIGEDFSFGYLVGAPKTIITYEGRNCAQTWRTLLSESIQQSFFPEEDPTEERWFAAYNKLDEQYTTICTPLASPFPELQQILEKYWNDEQKQQYLRQSSPGNARAWLQSVATLCYNDALPFLTTVCIQPGLKNKNKN
uniref:Structural polyprotein n=1 Tax=Bundaberg bee virus 2 TaxID=2201285 RepID=A0A2U8JQ85_9VIRU|nr:structural polyprotein [Bundaberg bee virus 2]